MGDEKFRTLVVFRTRDGLKGEDVLDLPWPYPRQWVRRLDPSPEVLYQSQPVPVVPANTTRTYEFVRGSRYGQSVEYHEI